MLIEQTQGVRERERASLAGLGPHMIDGAIVSPEALQAGDFDQLAPGLPVVLLGEHALDLEIDHVGIDNVLAARTAVDHLIRLGRARIAAIGENRRRGTAALRMAGYRAALAAADLPAPEELVASVEAYHRRDGADAMRRLLARPERPDAVFCFNDLLAVGALRSVAEAGLRVPEDLAVVGFDGSEEGAYSLPSLTTIAPDKAAIAAAAVNLLHRDGAGERPPPQDVMTSFTLEIRESSVGRPSGMTDGLRIPSRAADSAPVALTSDRSSDRPGSDRAAEPAL